MGCKFASENIEETEDDLAHENDDAEDDPIPGEADASDAEEESAIEWNFTVDSDDEEEEINHEESTAVVDDLQLSAGEFFLHLKLELCG